MSALTRLLAYLCLSYRILFLLKKWNFEAIGKFIQHLFRDWCFRLFLLKIKKVVWVVLVKKPKQGYEEKLFPTFKVVTTSFFTWKPNPLGLGNWSVPNFCETSFRYFCSLLSGSYNSTKLFMPKKSKLLTTREGWFKVFP